LSSATSRNQLAHRRELPPISGLTRSHTTAPRLIARGRPVRQLDALLIGHHALAEAEMEKVMRHDLLPPLDKEMDLSEATPCSHVAAPLSARSATLEPH